MTIRFDGRVAIVTGAASGLGRSHAAALAARGARVMQDFQAVVDVHLIGAAICSQAVWSHMRAASFGRILMTSSTPGIYGNVGQANHGAAKTGLIGLMNVLQIEGAKHDIRVNALVPAAATRMTRGEGRGSLEHRPAQRGP